MISRPYCSPDPSGPKYEQYCRQQLMMHQPFRQLKELLGTCDNHATAYSIFLQSVISPQSFADDIHQLEVMERENHINNNEEEVSPIFTFTLTCFVCIYILTLRMWIKNRVTDHSAGLDANMPAQN